MDIQTKIVMRYIFAIALVLVISQEIYKVIYHNHSIMGAIVLSLLATFGYGTTHFVLNHDIKKFERWKKQAKEYKLEEKGIVSDLSLSSTRENGRNTVILSATYNDYELTFSGINPDYQFKYKLGDPIDLLVHHEDKQRFVLKDLE